MDQPEIFDMTWLARIPFDRIDRSTSDWLPRGQRLVGPRFNDGERPEWMDDAEWRQRHRVDVPPPLRAADLRLKRILCEGGSVTPEIERSRD